MKPLNVWMAVMLATAACSDVTAPTRITEPAAPADKRATSGVTVAVLPSLGGSWNVAYGVNDLGEVVGLSTTTSGETFAVRWSQQSGGAWQVTAISGTGGSARAVNAAGDAVGSRGSLAKFWPRAGGEEDLGAGFATDINSSDLVVGFRSDVGRAAVWTRSGASWTAYDLAPLAGVNTALQHYEQPQSVNDAGVIVGFAHDNASRQYAVHWDPTGTPGVWSEARPFSVASGFGDATAEGVNGDNVIGAAFCFDHSCRPAYAWSLSGSDPGLLTTEDAVAEAINDARQFVGFVTARRCTLRCIVAFIGSLGQPVQPLATVRPYTDNTFAYDLNNPTATRSTVQVVGQGTTNRGASAALVWTVP